jgi:hypothetical protein
MSCCETIDTLILIALPASGKSEVRRYMFEQPRDARLRDFHIDENAQLDDFPYVHFMGRVDDELEARGHKRAFYRAKNDRFVFLGTWGVLLRLVNDDYAVLKGGLPTPEADVEVIFARIDAARAAVDGPPVFAGMDAALKAELVTALKPDAEFMMNELWEHRPESMEGRTTIIEFARGGPDGAEMPLSKPHGYAWNLSNLAPEILEKAAVIYIWVDPAESRRKNRARYVPGEEGSSLHHMAPEVVMLGDYGTCDIAYLMENAEKPSTIKIEAHGKTYHLPVARFDNRNDKTSFLHRDPSSWTEDELGTLRGALVPPMAALWDAYHAQRHAE